MIGLGFDFLSIPLRVVCQNSLLFFYSLRVIRDGIDL